jgi:hypothetical protein
VEVFFTEDRGLDAFHLLEGPDRFLDIAAPVHPDGEEPSRNYRAMAESDLGNCLILSGDLASAEDYLRRAWRTFETQRGASSERTLTARERLAQLYRACDRPDDAARIAVDRR